MAGLPFVVQPRLQPIVERIGDEDSGIIEVERRGFLSVAEKTFLQQGAGNDEVASHLLKVIRKVSSDLRIPADKAQVLVMDALSGNTNKDKNYPKVVENYSADLDVVTQIAVQHESKKEYLRAICMIIHRINSDFDLDNVAEIHPTIITGLSKLCEEEENKSTERLIKSKANSEFSSKETEVSALEKK